MILFRRLVVKTYTDQLGRQVTIPLPPLRIVSLVPSQTELLYDLGVDVAGITKFCVHPNEWFRGKPRVGGTKNISIDSIHRLSPDLIIANKEENDAAQVQALMEEFPVWVSDVKTLPDALDMIESIGLITGTQSKAAEIIHKVSAEFGGIPMLENSVKTAYFIWKDPWMVAGGDTFINDMLKLCGLHNVFGTTNRYPTVSIQQLKDSGCQLVLLSSEPYPFKDKHIAELQEILPAAKILLVDGEMYSWYGSRLIHAPAYFRSLIPLILR
jgi:ABC-type Fe3+-hydroxamate transport system substrate-binding protein